jgi:hypothetical protein
MEKRLLMLFAGAFALGELTALLLLGAVVFERGFDTQSILGAIGIAFVCAIVSSTFCILEFVLAKNYKRAAQILGWLVWAGFTVLLALTIGLYQIFIVKPR